jgi:hypothetical protein
MAMKISFPLLTLLNYSFFQCSIKRRFNYRKFDLKSNSSKAVFQNQVFSAPFLQGKYITENKQKSQQHLIGVTTIAP